MDKKTSSESIFLADILKEINRWLKNKYLLADFVKKVPGTKDTYDQFKNIFWRKVSSSYLWRDIIKEAVSELVSANGEKVYETFSLVPEKIKDYSAKYQAWQQVFLFDLKLEGNIITFFSWLSPDNAIVQIKLETCDIGAPDDEDGDYKKDAVKEVIYEAGKLPSPDDLIAMAKDALQIDFLKRWKLSSLEFQREHPICPVCGADVVRQDCEHSHHLAYNYVCNCCDWEMDRTKEFLQDLRSDYPEKIFWLERKAVERKFKNERARKASMEEIQKAISQLSKVYPEKKEYEREQIRSEIQQMLDKLIPSTKKERPRY